MKVVVCTCGSPSLPVMESSFKAYAPDIDLVIHHVERSTFGESYNLAMTEAFKEEKEIIIANDDIVLTPTSVTLLLEDVRSIQEAGVEKLGFVASFTDFGRAHQNIQSVPEQNRKITHVGMVAPIFSWINRAAFEEAQFPPLNWFSDDVICEDLNLKGYSHFLSRSYVHHVGSTSIGRDERKLFEAALPWLIENRPAYVEKWFQKK